MIKAGQLTKHQVGKRVRWEPGLAVTLTFVTHQPDNLIELSWEDRVGDRFITRMITLANTTPIELLD